jgi:hypothetical protein
MPMLDFDAADHETAARPAARSSSDTKAAIAYLIASGATAIYTTTARDFVPIRSGSQIAANAVAVFWIQKKQAVANSRLI